MRVLGMITMAAIVVAAAAAVVVGVTSLPDIKRYLKMRQM